MLNKNDLHELKKLVTSELHQHMYTNNKHSKKTSLELITIWRKLDHMLHKEGSYISRTKEYIKESADLFNLLEKGVNNGS